MSALCDVLAERGERYVLPALRAMADRRLGPPSYAAINAILRIEGVSPYDEKHPYAVLAREELDKDRKRLDAAEDRMSSIEYIVGEDLDIKASDSRCLDLQRQELSLSEWLIFHKS